MLLFKTAASQARLPHLSALHPPLLPCLPPQGTCLPQGLCTGSSPWGMLIPQTCWLPPASPAHGSSVRVPRTPHPFAEAALSSQPRSQPRSLHPEALTAHRSGGGGVPGGQGRPRGLEGVLPAWRVSSPVGPSPLARGPSSIKLPVSVRLACSISGPPSFSDSSPASQDPHASRRPETRDRRPWEPLYLKVGFKVSTQTPLPRPAAAPLPSSWGFGRGLLGPLRPRTEQNPESGMEPGFLPGAVPQGPLGAPRCRPLPPGHLGPQGGRSRPGAGAHVHPGRAGPRGPDSLVKGVTQRKEQI